MYGIINVLQKWSVEKNIFLISSLPSLILVPNVLHVLFQIITSYFIHLKLHIYIYIFKVLHGMYVLYISNNLLFLTLFIN